MMEIISEAAARAQGLKHYFTGKPCKRGHLSKRLVSNRHCVDCDRENYDAWTAKNIDKSRAYGRAWYDRNKEQEQAKQRVANMTPEQKERDQLHQQAYRERHPERARESVKRNNHKRRAQMKGTLSPDIYQRLHVAQRGQCVYCRTSLDEVTPHLDHIMPLALGGSNTDENVQLLCPTCNTSKGSTHPDEYEARIGYARLQILEEKQS